MPRPRPPSSARSQSSSSLASRISRCTCTRGRARRRRSPRRSRRRARALVNGIGATATGVVALVVVYTKFAGGAWLVTVAIPVLVLGMLGVRRHYERLARRLHAGAEAVVAAPPAHNTTLLVVE